MQFDLIRFVLIPQATLFADNISREQWLRKALSEPFIFVHRKRKYHFVPVAREDGEKGFIPIIMGRIGRQKIAKENEPPESGLEEVKREIWTAAHFYIDPRHHEDGQKVAFEQSSIGDPLNVVRSMALHLSNKTDAPYTIKANPIGHINNFISFLRDHPTDITYIQFDLNAPNMFDDRTNVDTEMRRAKEKYKAKRARITLASEEGMQLNDQRIMEMGAYALQGGGEVKAKAMNDASFSSSKTIETAIIDTPDDADERTILSIIWDRIFRR